MPVTAPLRPPTRHSMRSTPMLRTSTSSGSARLAGSPPGASFASLKSNVRRLAPEPLHDEAARHEVERAPHERGLARLDVERVAAPRDARDAHRRQQRSFAAFDRQAPLRRVHRPLQHVVERRLRAERVPAGRQHGDRDRREPRDRAQRAQRAAPASRRRRRRRSDGSGLVHRQNDSPTEKCRRTLLHVLPVRDVEAERADRRAHARADAIAGREMDVRQRVDRVAGVREHRGAPRRVEPVDDLGARDRVIAAADDRGALLHAQAVERIAAHRRVAAGAEQEGRRHADPGVGEHRAGFGARGELVVAGEGPPRDRLADHAAEALRRRAGHAARRPAGSPSSRASAAAGRRRCATCTRRRRTARASTRWAIRTASGRPRRTRCRTPACRRSSIARRRAVTAHVRVTRFSMSVRCTPAAYVSSHPPGVGGRTNRMFACLDLGLHARGRVHLERVPVDVHVAVRGAHLVLRVGRVARAELEATPGRLDHRQRELRVAPPVPDRGRSPPARSRSTPTRAGAARSRRAAARHRGRRCARWKSCGRARACTASGPARRCRR